MSEVNYRQQWAEGEIEAGTLLDAIDCLAAECERLREERDSFQRVGIRSMEERDAAMAELAALKGGREPYPHGHELHKAVFMALECFTGSDTFEGGVRGLIAELKEARAALSAPPAQASAWVAISDRTPPITGHYLAYGPIAFFLRRLATGLPIAAHGSMSGCARRKATPSRRRG